MKKVAQSVVVTIVCLLATGSLLFAQDNMGEMKEHHHHKMFTTKGGDPCAVAGNVYSKLLENEKVRVCDVKFKPGETAKMHGHPDHVVYALTDGTLSISTPDTKPITVDIKAGQTMWMPAVIHEAVNVGKTEIHLIVMELKGSNMAMEMEHEKMEKKEK